MKVGDSVPVVIAGQTVAMAEVKELADGTATLIVPATRVVMATRTELTVEAPRADGATVQILTDEVVRPEVAAAAAQEIAGEPTAPITNVEDAAPVETSSEAPAESAEAPVSDAGQSE